MAVESANELNSTQAQLQSRPWLVTSFINQPSPWVLRSAVFTIFFVVIAVVGASPFVMIQRKVQAPGKVVSQLGIRSVFTIRDGTFRRAVDENQQVSEGDRLGFIEIQGFEGTDIQRLHEVLEDLVDDRRKDDQLQLKARIDELDAMSREMRSTLTEADVGLPLAELNSLYNSMIRQKTEGKLAVTKETAPLKLSLRQLEKKIASLKRGKRVRDLAYFIETIEEDARRLRSSIAQIENAYAAKLNDTTQAFRSHVQRAQVQLSTIGRGAELRSPITGGLYKFHVQDKQQVTKGTLVAEIIPKDSVVVVKVGVRANDQPKVKTGLPVHFRMEAFPYQKFGTLAGQVLDVKPVSADGSFEVTASLLPNDKVKIEQVPIGSAVNGLIVVGESSLFSIALEKVVGDWK